MKTVWLYCTAQSNITQHGVRYWLQAKSRKYQGLFNVRSREKDTASLGKSGLNDWSISKSLKGGRNQVSGRESVPNCHVSSFGNGPWKLHIAKYDPRIDHKTSWKMFSSVPWGIPAWLAYWKVAWSLEIKYSYEELVRECRICWGYKKGIGRRR